MEKKMMESMKQKKIRKSLVVGGGDGAMEKKKEETTMENGGGGGGEYEKLREERMRENMERMEKLGIVSLSHKLNSTTERRGRGRGRRRRDDDGSPQVLMSTPKSITLPPRRSSRLQNTTPVPYAEISVNKDEKRKNMVFIEEGAREEFYTDEHAKLLGSCEMTWTLFVDGCDKDGRRIYDQVKGETCHQCRQKTLGLHTHCSKCDLVQGQFCGDCLYMRYGENVLEVNKNPSWICPVCRGICNCSLCRTKKGWAPTGSLYRKVLRLGFKSVAHYLIQTRRRETISADQISTETTSPKKELPVCDREVISHPVDAFESETNALNSESINKNSNSTIEENDTNDSSHPDEPTNGLNVDSFEKISNLSSEESKPLPVDEHANNSAIDVTPCGKSKKTKNSAAVASPDCIASKSPLPSNEPGNGVVADSCEKISNCCSEEGKPQCVDGHAANFVIDVKPRHKRKKSKDPAAIASPDCIASRLRRRRTTCRDATTTST